jgi:C4-dicarboxylate transporter, DctM subunit
MKLFTGIQSFEIMAIPFFILAGNFLTHGGVARRMIDFAVSLVGHLRGGLGIAGIVSCAMFALVCGSSVATVAAIGAIVLPEMVRHGYPMKFGAAIITVAGSLGILMLPSIPKIIYAVANWCAVCRGLAPWHTAHIHALRRHMVSCKAAQISAYRKGNLG